jgi:hypothetical protein
LWLTQAISPDEGNVLRLESGAPDNVPINPINPINPISPVNPINPISPIYPARANSTGASASWGHPA